MQTLSSVSFGYSNVRTNCVHCAALGGKVTIKLYTQAWCLTLDTSQIAAGWGSNVAIFQPIFTDGVGKVMVHHYMHIWVLFLQVFPAIWQLCDTLSLGGPAFSVCWKKSGSQLLVGGDSLSLWDSPTMTAKKDISTSTSGMKMIWSCRYVATHDLTVYVITIFTWLNAMAFISLVRKIGMATQNWLSLNAQRWCSYLWKLIVALIKCSILPSKYGMCCFLRGDWKF